VAVALTIIGTALFGSPALRERAFRLLRWIRNRPGHRHLHPVTSVIATCTSGAADLPGGSPGPGQRPKPSTSGHRPNLYALESRKCGLEPREVRPWAVVCMKVANVTARCGLAGQDPHTSRGWKEDRQCPISKASTKSPSRTAGGTAA
jgi:hypothetical protein